MKTTKIFAFLLAMLFTVFSFVSCNSNNLDGEIENLEEYSEKLKKQQDTLDYVIAFLDDISFSLQESGYKIEFCEQSLTKLLSDYEEIIALINELRANASTEQQDILSEVTLSLEGFNQKVNAIYDVAANAKLELDIALNECAQLCNEADKLKQKIQVLPLTGEDEDILLSLVKKAQDMDKPEGEISATNDVISAHIQDLIRVLENQKAILDAMR